MAAESRLFEIIGHADLPKKFGHRPTRDCTPLCEKFLAAAGKSGCAIELEIILLHQFHPFGRGYEGAAPGVDGVKAGAGKQQNRNDDGSIEHEDLPAGKSAFEPALFDDLQRKNP